MQATKASSERYSNLINPSSPTSTPSRWLTRVFGCWHGRKMGAPFTLENETYCTCMGCGARRQFNPRRQRMTGHYYYPPVTVLYDHDPAYHPAIRVRAVVDSFRPPEADAQRGVVHGTGFGLPAVELGSPLMNN